MNEIDSVKNDSVEEDQLNQEDLEIVAGGDDDERPPILVRDGD